MRTMPIAIVIVHVAMLGVGTAETPEEERQLSAERDRRIAECIKQLGTADYEARAQASARLLELCTGDWSLVARAAKSDNLEMATRARRVADKLLARKQSAIVGAWSSKGELLVFDRFGNWTIVEFDENGPIEDPSPRVVPYRIDRDSGDLVTQNPKATCVDRIRVDKDELCALPSDSDEREFEGSERFVRMKIPVAKRLNDKQPAILVHEFKGAFIVNVSLPEHSGLVRLACLPNEKYLARAGASQVRLAVARVGKSVVINYDIETPDEISGKLNWKKEIANWPLNEWKVIAGAGERIAAE